MGKKKKNLEWDDYQEFNKDEDGNDLGGLMAVLGKKPADKDLDDFEHNSIQNSQEEGEIRIKSKKEKERERKERLKAQAKKGKKSVLNATPVEELQVDVPAESIDTKKGKKGKGKQSAAIAALRNQVLLQKQLEEEEERRRLEEERLERERIEKEKEDERLKEELRLAKKEKEKAKKEQLKKEGKYLTPAQKLHQQAQQAKLEAMLASGIVKVEGLTAAGEKKKVVYDNRRKKKGGQKSNATGQKSDTAGQKSDTAGQKSDMAGQKSDMAGQKSDAAALPKENLKPVKDVPIVKPVPADEESEVKDSWDQSEDDVKNDDDVKEDWELSSEDEVVVVTKAASKVAIDKATKNPEPAKNLKPEKNTVKSESKTASNVVEPESKPTKNAVKPEPKPTKTESKSVSEAEEDSTDSDSSEESYSSDDGPTAAELQSQARKQVAHDRRKARIAQALSERSKDNLRSPIGVIMGHVDTGKTKLLDKIRHTNVQEGEAGGITQQIGATYFPIDAIEEKTVMIHKGAPSGYKLPGLLMIDTPGHESFTNLRSRGSSLCNIAVLVVDIVHGLEPQTIESLNMLKKRKTPFIVALNKIDRLFDWKAYPDYPTRDTLALQKASVLSEFEDRVSKTIVAFAEQGLNACLYWENKNMGRNVSLVPTSAVTGEGVPDLLHLLMDLTQNRMTESLMYLTELECTVLEVKVIEGLGTTIDVVLSNGVLNEGDKICLCGLNGPIVTTIRALLTPQPMRELRVKSAYQHHKTVKASLGIKIAAPDLEKAIAGSRLLLVRPDDDEEDLKDEVMGDLTDLMESIDKSGKGVCVQASTLGSLEALLSFLKDMKIPVSGINIGPVHKKDIIRASVMLERCKEYAQLLAFDVPIEREAEQMAADMGVQIFSANIIYHLFDKYKKYMEDLEEQKRKDAMPTAVFPCVLRMVPDAIFNKRSPIIIGVDVIEGSLKVGTPLCVVNKETQQTISLGKVAGIELNHKPRQEVKKGDPSVAIRIEMPSYNTAPTYGRHFVQEDDIYSKISRESIDVLKTTFRDKMGKEDWALVLKLKRILSIQ